MYCGDDVEAVVGDVGTSLSKFGLAGEDTPKLLLPSIVGLRPPSTKNSKDDVSAASAVLGDLWHRNDLEVVRPIEACAVANWDALEKVWSYSFERLHVDAKSHPVITSAASCFANDALHNAASRDGEKYLEMMFESFQVPAFYMEKDAVLDSFAFGRSVALIAEIGAGASRVVPVYDGYALERPAQYSSVGCNQLSEYLEHLVVTSKPETMTVRPRGTFSRKLNQQTGMLETIPLSEEFTTPPAMPASYLKFLKADLFRDMREATCIMSEIPLEEHQDSPVHGQKALSPEPLPLEITEQQYELPDGQTVVLGKERYAVPEFLLHPKNFGGAVVKNEQHAAAAAKVMAKGLHRMLYDAVHLCDADLRRDMLTNIILCGGGSLMPGITERLHAELTRMMPSTFKSEIDGDNFSERYLSADRPLFHGHFESKSDSSNSIRKPSSTSPKRTPQLDIFKPSIHLAHLADHLSLRVLKDTKRDKPSTRRHAPQKEFVCWFTIVSEDDSPKSIERSSVHRKVRTRVADQSSSKYCASISS